MLCCVPCASPTACAGIADGSAEAAAQLSAAAAAAVPAAGAAASKPSPSSTAVKAEDGGGFEGQGAAAHGAPGEAICKAEDALVQQLAAGSSTSQPKAMAIHAQQQQSGRPLMPLHANGDGGSLQPGSLLPLMRAQQ